MGGLNTIQPQVSLDEIRKFLQGTKPEISGADGFCDSNVLRALQEGEQTHQAFQPVPVLQGSGSDRGPSLGTRPPHHENVPARSASSGRVHPPRSSSSSDSRSHEGNRATRTELPPTVHAQDSVHGHLHDVQDSIPLRRGSQSLQQSSNGDQQQGNRHRLVQQNQVNSNSQPVPSRQRHQRLRREQSSSNRSRDSQRSSPPNNAVQLDNDPLRQVAQDSPSASPQVLSSQLQGVRRHNSRPDGSAQIDSSLHGGGDGEAQDRSSRSSSSNNKSLLPISGSLQQRTTQSGTQQHSSSNESSQVDGRSTHLSTRTTSDGRFAGVSGRGTAGRTTRRVRSPSTNNRARNDNNRAGQQQQQQSNDDDDALASPSTLNASVSNNNNNKTNTTNNKNSLSTTIYPSATSSNNTITSTNNEDNNIAELRHEIRTNNQQDLNDQQHQQHPTHHGASIKYRSKETKVADKHQLEDLEYHCKKVNRYTMPMIRRRANSATRQRLQEVELDVNRPYGPDLSGCKPVKVPVSKSVLSQHSLRRVEFGTIKLVSPADEAKYPSLGVVNEFCVVEQKKKIDKKTMSEVIFDRLRQIDEPRKQNEALRNRNFKTTAPLKHFSHYHRRILSKKALIADLEASFYGYELEDPVARSFYRFRDETGQLYELSVLMMGLVASVELQQIITSIIAGHQDYVLPKFAAPALPEIWVDNIRFCGDEKILKKCDSFLRQSMNDCNASLDIEGISSEYDFLGATWNHINKTVELAKKNRLKLPDVLPSKMTARELEGLIGRLIFVAQIMQDPLVNHYWLLKWARRFLNGLNTGRITPEQEISIPLSAAASLSRWLDAAKRPHKVRFANPGNKRATLFTDASLGGWGAVLVFADGSIHIAGGKLTEKDHNGNINVAESIALQNALTSFSKIISSLSISTLDILVDNTSVEHNVRRGMPRADDLASFVKNIWSQIFSLNITVTVNRVSTHMNPADSISRGRTLEFFKLQQALGQFKNDQQKSLISNSRLGLEERHILVPT